MEKRINFSYVGKAIKYLSLIVIPAIIIYFSFAVYAGTLAPGAPAGPTMNTVEEIHAVITDTYDSSAVVPNENGDVLEILKCITTKMNGGSCYFFH